MAGVNGEYIATGYDLQPGDTDTWVFWGATPRSSINVNGVVHTFWAEMLRKNYGWEVVFEVTYIASEVGADGASRIFVNVTNKSPAGSIYGSYKLLHCWTDPLI